MNRAQRQKVRWMLFLLAITVILWGCRKSVPSISPLRSPQRVPTTSLGVTQLLNDGRRDTAWEAYSVALAQAQLWNNEALLYQIPITYIMEHNLGIPPGMPGWFFMFKVPDSSLEYYVKVVNGHVVGMTEAQPIVVGKLPYEYLPIDPQMLSLNSDDVVWLFLERGGAEYVTSHPGLKLDYRLVHLKGQTYPVWSLFDVADGDPKPLFHINAVTGEPTDDPFSLK